MILKLGRTRSSKKWIWGLSYLGVGFLLYMPILDNAFLSDDYDSLFRIVVEKRVIVKEFFRPMIDWTFYFNYMLSGMDPFGYYLLNLLVHVINPFLVYRLTTNLLQKESPGNREKAALISGFLFLVYPFHNEGVVWLTGRLASISCLFALLATNILFSKISSALKGIFFVLFYFTGLLAYESILLLPFILLCFWWRSSKSPKEIAKAGLVSAMLVAGYLLIRYLFSEAVYGGYGERMLTGGPTEILLKFLKTFGRAILPPLERSGLLVTLFAVVMGMLIWGSIRLFKNKNAGVYRYYLVRIGLAFLLSMTIPVLFGVSTRTSEGDRLLYFPSVFLAIMVAQGLMQISHKFLRRASLALVSVYFVGFLMVNNAKWEKASTASEAILTAVMENKEKQSVIINLPDELEGAFVFRNGFHKALYLRGADTGSVTVNNYLTRLDYLEINGRVGIDSLPGSFFIAPVTIITPQEDGEIVKIENIASGKSKMVNTKTDVLFFWNKFEFKKIQ